MEGKEGEEGRKDSWRLRVGKGGGKLERIDELLEGGGGMNLEKRGNELHL